MVAHTWLPSIGFQSWSQFLAVSLHMTRVINPAVSCHYFPPGLQSPSQTLRGLPPIPLLGAQRVWTVCLRLLPDSIAAVTWTKALTPEFSMLTTRLPNHPVCRYAHTCLTSLCPGLPGWASTRKVNQYGFYWSKRQWVAVALKRLVTVLNL